VFEVNRPGLWLSITVDRDRNMVRMRAVGAKSETSLPEVRTVTRGVSKRELQQIIGTGARLAGQFQRIMGSLMGPST
jgi:hypothetical protein